VVQHRTGGTGQCPKWTQAKWTHSTSASFLC
jgi:hypothetical protein